MNNNFSLFSRLTAAVDCHMAAELAENSSQSGRYAGPH